MSQESRDDISIFGLASALLRRWRWLVFTPAVGAVLAVAIVVLLPRTYTALSMVQPRSDASQTGRLAGVASQFGVNLGGNRGTEQSPEFYAQLIRSRGLLKDVASTRFRFGRGMPGTDTDTLEGTIAELYGLEAGNTAKAIRILSENVVARPDLSTGIVTVTTTAKWPGLAVAVNNRILELVNDFNVNTLQSQAAAERRFLESRLDTAQKELRAAEGRLQTFLEENLRYQSSPRLSFEAARLQRMVDLRQQVVMSLAQALEEARGNEVRNTPVLTTVEGPADTVRPSPRRVPLVALIGILAGGILGFFFALLAEFLRQERSRNPGDYEEFQRLSRALARRFRRAAGPGGQ